MFVLWPTPKLSADLIRASPTPISVSPSHMDQDELDYTYSHKEKAKLIDGSLMSSIENSRVMRSSEIIV